MSERIEKTKAEIAAMEGKIQEYEKRIEELEGKKYDAKEFEDYKKRVDELRRLRFKRKRLTIDIEEARKREADEAQKEIERIDGEVLKVGEEILDALFRAYALTFRLKELSRKAGRMVSEYEEFDLHSTDLIISNLGNRLGVFLQQELPFATIEHYAPATPLRNKIISKMKETGLL